MCYLKSKVLFSGVLSLLLVGNANAGHDGWVYACVATSRPVSYDQTFTMVHAGTECMYYPRSDDVGDYSPTKWIIPLPAGKTLNCVGSPSQGYWQLKNSGACFTHENHSEVTAWNNADITNQAVMHLRWEDQPMTAANDYVSKAKGGDSYLLWMADGPYMGGQYHEKINGSNTPLWFVYKPY